MALLQKRQSHSAKIHAEGVEANQQYIINDEIDNAAAILDVGTMTYAPAQYCRLPRLDASQTYLTQRMQSQGIPQIEMHVVEALHSCYSFASQAGFDKPIPSKLQPISIGFEQGRHAGRLHQLIQEINALVEVSKLSRQQTKRALVLRMQCNAALLHVTTIADPYQCSYDRLTSTFESIVRDAEVWSTVEVYERPANFDPDPAAFSIVPDIGIVQPVFDVVNKCRHPHVRRRALALLARERQEGPWNSRRVLALGSRALAIEEGTSPIGLENFTQDTPLSAFIPETDRLTSIGFDVTPACTIDSDQVIGIFSRIKDIDGMLQEGFRITDTMNSHWETWREKCFPTTPPREVLGDSVKLRSQD